MKILTSILFVLSFLCFSSCSTTIYEDGDTLSKSYVQIYIKATSMTAIYYKDCQAIQIAVEGEPVRNPESVEFNELINHFGDNTYNQKRPSIPNSVIANEFDAIEIISNKDFSADLPAGTSLAGVMKLYGLSPAKYIKSKYTELFDWVNDQPEEFKKDVWSVYRGIIGYGGYYPVLKTVSELNAEDMLLLSPDQFYLRFTEIPTIKEHTFTITLKYGEKSFNTDVNVVFD